MKLKANRELPFLTKETDLLNLKEKSKLIRLFIEDVINDENNIQMIALYGEWGSGKTSLMNDIIEDIDKERFKPIFFEAWRYEKDNNIPKSLFTLMLEELQDSKLVNTKEIVENASGFLESLSKGVSFNLGLVNISGKDIIDSLNDKIDIEQESKSIEKIEADLNKNLSENGRVLIFIDDLDRCEPHKVIDLLSSIKLFFTYGNKLTFICGIDFEATKKAIQIKYGNVIRAEDYLEKIFDHSFNMPKKITLDC